MVESVASDMVLFLWSVLKEPIQASVAMASAIAITIVIATYLNFMLIVYRGNKNS